MCDIAEYSLWYTTQDAENIAAKESLLVSAERVTGSPPERESSPYFDGVLRPVVSLATAWLSSLTSLLARQSASPGM